MAGQLQEMHKNAKLHSWYEDIKARKESGLSVDVWCEEKGITRSTYYYRYQKVMSELETRFANKQTKELRFAQMPTAPGLPEPKTRNNSIFIRQGSLEVEIPSGSDPANIRAVVEALGC